MSGLNPMFSQASGYNQFGQNPLQVPNMLSGVPGMGGDLGPLMSMLMMQLMPAIMGNNFMPMGFGNTQSNPHSMRMAFDQMAVRQQAMTGGAQADQEAIKRMIEGFFLTTTGKFTSTQRQASGMVAGDIAGALPMLAQIPAFRELLGSAFGRNGSGTLMGMDVAEASRLTLGPGGRIGITGPEASSLANQLRTGYKSEDYAGLRGDETSAAMLEMQRRGTLHGTGGVRLDNVDRIKQQLKDRAGAVKAMKEIFGDMGQPNAPMNQIFNGLDMITQGQFANMDPQKAEQLVRKMQNLAKTTDTSIDQVLRMSASARQLTDQLGLKPDFVPSITANAMAGSHVMRAENRIGGFFGAHSYDQVNADIQRRTAGAGASDMAQRMGMVAFLSRAANGGNGLTGEAKELAQALAAGSKTFKGRSIYEVLNNEAGLHNMMIKGGASKDVIGALRSSPMMMQEDIVKGGYDVLAQQGQMETDILPGLIHPTFGGAAFDALQAGGMIGKDAHKESLVVSKMITSMLTNLTTAERANPSLAHENITKKLRAQHPALRNLPKAAVYDMVVKGWALAQEQSGGDLLNITNIPDADKKADYLNTVKAMGTMQSWMSSQGGNQDVLMQFSDLLQGAAKTGKAPDFNEIAGKMLGGTATADMKKQLAEKLKGTHDTYMKSTDYDKANKLKEAEALRVQASVMLKDADEIVDTAKTKATGGAFGQTARAAGTLLDVIPGGSMIKNAAVSAYSDVITERDKQKKDEEDRKSKTQQITGSVKLIDGHLVFQDGSRLEPGPRTA